eukprot:IDg8735t1
MRGSYRILAHVRNLGERIYGEYHLGSAKRETRKTRIVKRAQAMRIIRILSGTLRPRSNIRVVSAIIVPGIRYPPEFRLRHHGRASGSTETYMASTINTSTISGVDIQAECASSLS